MCSLFRNVLLLTIALLIAQGAHAAPPLRICADPDDLPFSNRAGQGFDNRVAVMLAQDLHRGPVFVWVRTRRGFMREQFNKGACDVLMGVPAGMKAVATSQPYYRSTYVFVTPKREHLQVASFTDPHLDHGRIGLQILEEDFAPPSVPLIRSGHAAQLVGFESFGTRAGEIVRAVASGRVGTAVVWGPLAGFYMAKLHLPLELTAVSPAVDASGVPFTFALTAGVHKNDPQLCDAVSASIARLQPRIDKLLAEYHVPMVPAEGSAR